MPPRIPKVQHCNLQRLAVYPTKIIFQSPGMDAQISWLSRVPCLQISWYVLNFVTIWLFNIAMENPLGMEVSSWENHLFKWAIFQFATLNNQRVGFHVSKEHKRSTSIRPPFFYGLPVQSRSTTTAPGAGIEATNQGGYSIDGKGWEYARGKSGNLTESLTASHMSV